MNILLFPASLSNTKKGYALRLVDFPSCIVQGNTVEDVREGAIKLLEGFSELPKPSEYIEGVHLVPCVVN